MDKPQSDLKPSDFAAASPVKFQQNAAQKRFLEDDLKVLRKELDAMPTMGAICIFTVQLMGVIPIIMCIPSCTASDESGGIIILASVWTVIWCLCSIWVCYPLAQALKLENSSEIGLLSGLPLYGPIVIMSLAKKAKETVSIQP